MMRSKARWTEYGEKNTRYFLNLEKRKAEKKRIVELYLEDVTENQDTILKEEDNFVKSLYKSSNNNTETTDSEAFFKNEVIKPLSDESADLCEGRIS